MLIEDALFNLDHPMPMAAREWGDAVIRRATFDALDLEGLMFDGLMEGCVVTSSQFYWAFFNTALLARTRFEACRFMGASFRGCLLVDCEFVDCRFELDNIGGDCTIEHCTIAACRFVGCTWIAREGDRRDISRTAWLGCAQERCTGLEGLF